MEAALYKMAIFLSEDLNNPEELKYGSKDLSVTFAYLDR
jgi:hypothetical protein